MWPGWSGRGARPPFARDVDGELFVWLDSDVVSILPFIAGRTTQEQFDLIRMLRTHVDAPTWVHPHLQDEDGHLVDSVLHEGEACGFAVTTGGDIELVPKELANDCSRPRRRRR